MARSAALQGGLGLPDRDYYVKDDPKSVDLRKAYVTHVQKMFELLGDPPNTAGTEAQTVMRIETALAKGSMTRVERRDPKNLDHKMILNRKDPILPLLQKQGEPLFLLDANPTAENIARLIYDYTAEQGFPVIEVQLWETENCYASYAGNP